MKLFAFFNPDPMSFLGSIIGSKVKLHSIMASLAPVPTAAISGYSLWKTAWSSILSPVSGVVSDVLGVRAGSEVLDPVVQGVPVDVVNHVASRQFSAVERHNDTMDREGEMDPRKIGVNRELGGSFGGSLVRNATSLLSGPSGIGSFPELVRDEVVPGSILPVQFSRFWIVAKGFLKKLDWRQWSARAHNQSFGYVSQAHLGAEYSPMCRFVLYSHGS